MRDILSFSNKIDRDPGIIVGRLANDNYVRYGDYRYEQLKKSYSIKVSL